MFKKVEEYLKKKQEAVKQKNELAKAQAYYRLVKAGATFIQFVQEDMKKNQDQVNRATRRRMEAELNEKGVLSPELVQYYSQKIDWVLMNIHQRLNPPKQAKGYNPPPSVEVRPDKPAPKPPEKTNETK